MDCWLLGAAACGVINRTSVAAAVSYGDTARAHADIKDESHSDSLSLGIWVRGVDDELSRP